MVATPGDALELLATEDHGSVVDIVCAQPGTADERAALDRAAADCGRRGVRVAGDPWVIDAEVGKITALVLDALHELRPLTVRTLDPDPAHVSFDAEAKRPVIAEPPLRGSVARATVAAARTYQRECGFPVFVNCHRAGTDPRLGAQACTRYPLPGRWLVRGADGRLTAYLPSAAGVLRWTEGSPGADEWSGPEVLEGPDLLPGITVVQDANGYAHLLGLRRRKRADGKEHVDLVHATQYQTGRPMGPWHSVGNPNANDRSKAREVGFPVAVFDAAGNLHVFVRNFGHGVSTRRQSPDGRWSGWQHLRGAAVADELVALPGRSGGAQVWARARDSASVVRWHQEAPGGDWALDPVTHVSPYPGTLSAAPEAGTIRYRYFGTNEVCVEVPGVGPVSLGGADGSGPLAAVPGVEIQGWGCTVLARSGHAGTCAVGAHEDGRPETGVWWFDAGETSLVPPAVAVDGGGRAVIALLGTDGRLRVARQEPGVSGLAFAQWVTA
ncbi:MULTISPECIES: hypothetical protein [unclassified Streptomyces]|uniref:hypothetical protein n=1 Tax=unclassified Streptomyces TaxID=2593676 RepID=UPI002253FCBC|nr:MULTISPECIES: hypothetical protein [unclassified Streptomyces]WSJ35618.1 hypothetical protein OG772_05860 [Streptomyces sp. NBC_01321]WSP58298.1 hypothetical protein OG306_30860 [Streptomyces sp. NBC_01241]WSU21126.1 hypothetical protein OG508_09145 [Streptomyces sp. NBC_01108]